MPTRASSAARSSCRSTRARISSPTTCSIPAFGCRSSKTRTRPVQTHPLTPHPPWGSDVRGGLYSARRTPSQAWWLRHQVDQPVRFVDHPRRTAAIQSSAHLLAGERGLYSLLFGQPRVHLEPVPHPPPDLHYQHDRGLRG